MERNIVEISEDVWIYLPEGLTPEQETKVIAHYLGSFEPEAHELRCRELLGLHAVPLNEPHVRVVPVPSREPNPV